MDYNEFVDLVYETLKNEVPEGITVKRNEILKNNGAVKRGVTFIENNISASPTFYFDGYYELYNRGMDISEVVENILSAFYTNRLKDDINMDFFFDFDTVKEKLYLKLINYDMNRELLKNVPFEKYMDLALVVYCRLDDTRIGEASILIKNEHLDKWGVAAGEVVKIARDNTRYKMEYTISNITSVLKDMTGEETDLSLLSDTQPPMYIMTNIQKCFGAVFMIYNDIMNGFCEMFGGDCCVIPSSVHEVLVVPGGDASVECLNEMIREVNREHVAIEERLSDHAYLYRSIGGFAEAV